MPMRDPAPTGAPCWVDLMSSDPERSKAFYGTLFGWTADAPNPDFGGYTNLRHGGDVVAGLMQATPDMGAADVWSVYLAVEDAAATVAAAERSGASVLVPATEIGTLGSMAVVADPGGAAVGVWQPGEHKGGVVAEVGAPCHFELHTRAYDRVLPFYADVFGWSVDSVADTAEFRYSVLPIGDGQNAGIMDATATIPEGTPDHWTVYFAVADMDSALEQVRALGGSVQVGPDDSPYGVLAVATDSTGAVFSLRAPSRS